MRLENFCGACSAYTLSQFTHLNRFQCDEYAVYTTAIEILQFEKPGVNKYSASMFQHNVFSDNKVCFVLAGEYQQGLEKIYERLGFTVHLTCKGSGRRSTPHPKACATGYLGDCGEIIRRCKKIVEDYEKGKG